MKTIIVNNIKIDLEKLSIVSIVNNGLELIYKPVPFFSIKLRDQDASSIVINSFSFNYIKSEGNSHYYQNKSLDVLVNIENIKDGLSSSIKIKNKTKYVIEWVELSSFGVNTKLKEEGGLGEILFPFNEGCIVSSLSRREKSPFPFIEPDYPSLGKFSIFPNMICSQFISYLNSNRGIYLAAYDDERCVKHVDFVRDNNSCRIFIRSYTSLKYKQDYEMKFKMNLILYTGNFYDACEIYRTWFYNHKIPNLFKIKENMNLPSWYHDSPLVLTFPIRGKKDTGDMSINGFYPYENTIKICKEISNLTNSKVMELLMQWESGAPWAPPYYWPPIGGEKEFKEFLDESHKENMVVGLYCSGLGWTEYSKNIPSYNKQQIFMNNKYERLMCANSDGTMKSTIVDNIRFGYDICPYQEESKKLFVDNINIIASSDIDYIQAFDQNHGGNSYFCYSHNHGHPDVPGVWQVKSTSEIMDRLNKSKIYGCESAASEPFISNLLFSDNRFNLNYYIGKPFPLYSYIYHEFLNNFMGNQICMTLEKNDYNYAYRVSHSFICGDMLTGVINDKGEFLWSWCDLEITNQENAIDIFKNLNGWRIGLGKNYLHYGKMVKPIEINCNDKTFKCEDSTILHVNGVQTSAFEFNNVIMQFVVNYQNEFISINLDKKYPIYEDYNSSKFKILDTIKIAPRSAIMIKLK